MQPRIASPERLPSAVVVPFHRVGATQGEAGDAGRLAPARGLMIGLLAGAILWAAFFLAAWAVFR